MLMSWTRPSEAKMGWARRARIMLLAGQVLQFLLVCELSRTMCIWWIECWYIRNRATPASECTARSRLRRCTPSQIKIDDFTPELSGVGGNPQRRNRFWWDDATRKFSTIDSYVHRRLATFTSKEEGRRGRSWKTIRVILNSALRIALLERNDSLLPDAHAYSERCRKALRGRITCTV